MNDSNRSSPSLDNVLEGYLTLYKAQMEHWRATVQVEWRVTFAAWTLLVAIAYGAAKEKVRFPHIPWPFYLLIPIAHFVWLYMIHASEDADKALWAKYRRKALDLLEGDSPALPTDNIDSWKGRSVLRHAGWLSVELGMTILLTYVGWRVLSNP